MIALGVCLTPIMSVKAEKISCAIASSESSYRSGTGTISSVADVTLYVDNYYDSDRDLYNHFVEYYSGRTYKSVIAAPGEYSTVTWNHTLKKTYYVELNPKGVFKGCIGEGGAYW